MAKDTCPQCNGSGLRIKGHSQDVWCWVCRGTGER